MMSITDRPIHRQGVAEVLQQHHCRQPLRYSVQGQQHLQSSPLTQVLSGPAQI